MIFSYLLNMQSHPSWVCGLKPPKFASFEPFKRSHPSWVCGLKHSLLPKQSVPPSSHPSWVCGLKQLIHQVIQVIQQVTPFVGVWIETFKGQVTTAVAEGHTLRGCVD